MKKNSFFGGKNLYDFEVLPDMYYLSREMNKKVNNFCDVNYYFCVTKFSVATVNIDYKTMALKTWVVSF